VKVLITGAAGFVAGHMAEFLRQEEPDVEVFGLARPHGAPAEVSGRVTVIEADLLDAPGLEAAVTLAQPDRIVHLAAQSSPHKSWADPEGTLRTNVVGTLNLLEAARKCRTPPRVLLVGSSEEYGLAQPSEIPLREETPLRPNSPYAVSKVAQGYLGLQYALVHRVPVVRTRTFHHTGPGRGEIFAESSFARQIVEIELRRREPVLAVGNLDAIRDFADVRDVVRAYWAVLDRGESGEVYNVCTGRGRRIRDLLEILLKITGARVDVRIDERRLRPSDIPVLVGAPDKLFKATGWEPRIPLERTLRDLLNDWRDRLSSHPRVAS
jgi:GDP-4-dehydro-6-deoxy-D-mannose reductase